MGSNCTFLGSVDAYEEQNQNVRRLDPLAPMIDGSCEAERTLILDMDEGWTKRDINCDMRDS